MHFVNIQVLSATCVVHTSKYVFPICFGMHLLAQPATLHYSTNTMPKGILSLRCGLIRASAPECPSSSNPTSQVPWPCALPNQARAAWSAPEGCCLQYCKESACALTTLLMPSGVYVPCTYTQTQNGPLFKPQSRQNFEWQFDTIVCPLLSCNPPQVYFVSCLLPFYLQ